MDIIIAIIIVICNCQSSIKVRRNLIFPFSLIFAVPLTLNLPFKDANDPASSVQRQQRKPINDSLYLTILRVR